MMSQYVQMQGGHVSERSGVSGQERACQASLRGHGVSGQCQASLRGQWAREDVPGQPEGNIQ